MSLLFIELCAGTAALSLRLHGGKHARPPVSRMGAKTGYASAILRIMGLRAGYDRADHYVWCEPDAGCRLLLEAYRSRELATQAAEVIRGWADEFPEPRALWERLRAEGPVKGTQPREVARWSCGMLWTVAGTWPGGGFCGPGHVSKSGKVPFPSGTTYQRHIASRYERLSPDMPSTIEASAEAVDPREVARWALVSNGAYRKGDPSSGYNPKRMEEQPPHATGGRQPGLLECMPPRFQHLLTLPSTIEATAEAVDPREVARWIQIVSSNRLINMGSDWMNTGEGGTCFGGDFATPTARILSALHSLPAVPAELLTDGQALTPPRIPDGVRVVVYIDPPYLNTTGYQHDLSREAVIQLARAWDEVGADVYISEAEEIPLGWHTTDITDTRVGQKRTFSKQQREILTHNRAPQWTPPKQESLW